MFLTGGVGEWDQFTYVTKIAFFGWAFHFCKSSSVMHRVDLTLSLIM